jgi:hypothetical protein
MSDSREAFEKWAKGDLDLQHIGVCYGDETTDAAFRAWQAAQGQSSKPCPYIVTGGEGTSWCRLAAKPTVNQQLLEALIAIRSCMAIGIPEFSLHDREVMMQADDAIDTAIAAAQEGK